MTAVADDRRGGWVERLTASTRATWWVSFVLLAVASSTWAVAMPLWGGPDEPAHAARSASLVGGEWLGVQTEVIDNNALLVTVPEAITSGTPGCFVFDSAVPADCAEWIYEDRDTEVLTTAGRHPPAFYAAIGLPIVFAPSEAGLYGMRLLGALTSAAVLASALTTLLWLARRRDPGAGLAPLGLLVALSPMVLFITGLINPSSWEITGAIGTWVGGVTLVLLAGEGRRVPTRVVAATAVAASVLVLSRALAPIWLAGIAIVLVIIARPGALRALVAERAVRIAAGVVAAATTAQVLWLLLASPLAQVDTQRSLDLTLTERVSQAFENSLLHPRDMVGRIGWLDVWPPAVTVWVWLTLALVVVAVGLWAGSLRQRLGILAVVAATAVIPVLFDAMQASRTGYVWQARYTIPVAVGIPLVSAVVAATSRRRPLLPPRLVLPVAAAGFVIGHVALFYNGLRRYAVGVDGPRRFLSVDTPWSPPGGNLLAVMVYVGVIVALAWWVAAPRRPVAAGDDAPTPDSPSPEVAPSPDEAMPPGHTAPPGDATTAESGAGDPAAAPG